ncbi:MAG TPA: transglycosylase domain-containing protein [Polyangiales bacterium]
MNKLAMLVGVALAALALYLGLEPLPEAIRQGRGELALRDAHHELLRERAGDDGLRARWVPLREIPPDVLHALIAGEDHRLYEHHGVDPLGVVRALWLDLRALRTVSGGSTLAMQLARMSYGLSRSPWGKLVQSVRALALQAKLGPEGVAEAWLNLAPFGHDVRGIAEASHAYFGRPLRDLTRGEAIALACLPRGPALYDPYRHADRLIQRRSHVLALMERRHYLAPGDRARLSRASLALVPFVRAFRAPHASVEARAEAVRRGASQATELLTTLEPNLQKAAQAACVRAVGQLARQAATSCAAVVQRVSTGEIVALVGSPDFHSAHAGQVDATRALRQPGSALKPFVYALAFEQGKTPSSRIVDEPMSFPAQFGRWLPENYDRKFHGEISLREALANSYNVPAAKLTAELGVGRVLDRLRTLGLSTLREPAEFYGIGLALGVGEVTLYELVGAYAALARGGEYVEPTLLRAALHGGRALPLTPRSRRRVFPREVAAQVSDVLADDRARRPAFGASNVLELPFPAAVKTGTSSHYRDNWTIGYAGDTAIGVWVGRHDGAPLHGVSGVSGAGPAFRQLMLAAEGKRLPRAASAHLLSSSLTSMVTSSPTNTPPVSSALFQLSP